MKFIGRERFDAQIVAEIKDTDTLSSVNSVCEMFCSLPYERQQELREDIEANGLPSLKVFAEKMAQLNQSDVTVNYYCPLDVDLYYGDDGEYEERYGDFLVPYEDRIREALKREQEGDDMASYFNEDNSVAAKLRSVEWDVEVTHGELYGKITAHLTEPFTEDEESSFLDWVSGQNADGLGEGFEQRAIPTEDGSEMYVHLWTWDARYFICREDQLDEFLNYHYGMGGMEQ